MKFLQSILIVIGIALAVEAKPGAVQSRMQAMFQKLELSSFADSSNPELSAECFALYLPMLNEVADTFSTEYQACIVVANNKTANLTASALQSQTLYRQQVTQLCSAFTTCDTEYENDTLSFFKCYSTASKDDISVVYNLSADTSASASTFLAAIQLIQDEQYQCTNTTEATYVRATANTYELLDNCLIYGVPTTTAAPTTTTPLSSTDIDDSTTSPLSTEDDSLSSSSSSATDDSVSSSAASTVA